MALNEKIEKLSLTHVDYFSFRELVSKIWTSCWLGNRTIHLDFSNCELAFAGPMLAVCSTVAAIREKTDYNVKFTITLPKEDILRRLFINSNWANILSPEEFESTGYLDDSKVPALWFRNSAEQREVVVRVINSFMRSMHGFSRNDLSSLDWSISEMTDNVLLHSRSPIGGMVQVMNMRKQSKIEIAICDPGIGINESLKFTSPGISTDESALLQCVKKGVTRDPRIGKGYGLYGSSCIAINSGGYFYIHAGKSYLMYPQSPRTRRRSIVQPQVVTHRHAYHGTLIMSSIDISSPDTLFKALSLDDGIYKIPDTIEHRYETLEKTKEYDDIVIRIEMQTDSFGSRVPAYPLRQLIENALRLSDKQLVVLDFSGVEMVSHSFADEAVGKLYIHISMRERLKRLRWVNINPICEKILLMVIAQNSAM